MSLRKLPDIKALDSLSSLTFEPDEAALARWRPGIHAAVEGDDNVISIYDIIGEDFWTGQGVTSKRVAAALRKIGKNDVTVNLNSPGGDFFEGTAIYNLLLEHPAKVTVKIMGLAASAASLIAMAGDEIQIAETGFIMVHNAWGIVIGNRHELRQAADRLEPFDAAAAGVYAARAGVDIAEAAAWMDAETWFNGRQAIEAGLADGFLPSSQIAEDAKETTKSLAAIRRVDAALAMQGIPRSERRALLNEVKRSTRDAVPSATHDAGDLVAAIRQLGSTLRS